MASTPNQLETIISPEDVDSEGHLASDLERDPLSPRDREILGALANPANEDVPMKDIAARFGITPRQLTRIRSKDVFIAEFQGALMRRVQRHIPAVISAMVETAKLEGREGFQDRKLLLQLAGLGVSSRPGSIAAAAAAGAAMGSQLGDRYERALNQAATAAEQPAPVVIDHSDPLISEALPD